MTAGLCQSSLLSGALRSRRRASGCPSAPRCSAGESNGNGNGGAEHLARAGVTELLSSSGSLSHGDSANSSLRKKRRGGGQRANGVPADFVARASELEALGSITKLELGTQVEEEAAQSSAHRTTGKAPFYLVRTDGFICTREKVDDSNLRFSHPTTQQQMLMWKTRPKCVLVIKKLGDELLQHTMDTVQYLKDVEGMRVIVERDVYDRLGVEDGFGYVETYSPYDWHSVADLVDIIVCLGGDGVILHASTLFREATPPIVSFALGSLGFLTAHEFGDYKEVLSNVLKAEGNAVKVTLRMRLRCEVLRNGVPIPGEAHDVVNEVVVHRGSNPYLSLVECYERDRLITKVQADGVLLATPTGSTAYNVASGGSMVHPNVPAILFTPICPHSLSFRPVILPDSAELELKIPLDARSSMWVCFDGKKRRELLRGDSIRVRMSEFPIPTVNKNDQTDDWFASLSRCLNWNERTIQKSISEGYAEMFADEATQQDARS